MTAKAFLGQARRAELQIRALLERRERCRELAERWGKGEVMGANELVERRGKGEAMSADELVERRRTGEATGAADLAGLEAELDRRIGDYVERVQRIEAAVDSVAEERCRDILRYRYLNGWSWRVIARRTGYSEAWLMKLHARGLAMLEGNQESGKRGTAEKAPPERRGN